MILRSTSYYSWEGFYTPPPASSVRLLANCITYIHYAQRMRVSSVVSLVHKSSLISTYIPGINEHLERTEAYIREDGTRPKPSLLEQYLHHPIAVQFDNIDIVTYHADFQRQRCHESRPTRINCGTKLRRTQLPPAARASPMPKTNNPSDISFHALLSSEGQTWYLWLRLKNRAMSRRHNCAFYYFLC